jgi:hypothetical protein
MFTFVAFVIGRKIGGVGNKMQSLVGAMSHSPNWMNITAGCAFVGGARVGGRRGTLAGNGNYFLGSPQECQARCQVVQFTRIFGASSSNHVSVSLTRSSSLSAPPPKSSTRPFRPTWTDPYLTHYLDQLLDPRNTTDVRLYDPS